MLKNLYPQKSKHVLRENQWSLENLAYLNTTLTQTQKNYPVILLADDLPLQLQLTLGQMLNQISLSGCTQANLDMIRTSLQLLRTSNKF